MSPPEIDRAACAAGATAGLEVGGDRPAPPVEQVGEEGLDDARRPRREEEDDVAEEGVAVDAVDR